MIFIDGDACPVKKIVMEEAEKYDEKVTIVTSLSHYSKKELPAHVEVVYVDEGADSADFRLVALLKKSDILVTQDYGLASLALPKGVHVCHHTGFEYDSYKIDMMLETRFASAKLRKAGQRTKGPKKFTDEDRQKFRTLLMRLLQNKKESLS